MNSDKDTICAIATGVGEGGISIVRISGPASLVIADAVFHGKNCTPSKMAGGTFAHGFIKPDANGTNVDEVVLLVYRAPNSYTREDVVEIQGHGGRVCAQRILKSLLDNGARLSEPGEFTKRAFLNGRIDLIQAEAVCDLVRAQSERAASAAMEQLEGRLSSSLNEIYSIGIAAAADLEATLDFDEDELPARVQAGVLSGISDAIRMTTALLATWEEGHLLRDGAKVVISGRPNVGKSTLMNLLLGKDRSIVADLPGTTRDVIEEQMLIDGIPVRLFDTAGLRESDCDVEREGVRRAQASIQQADMNIHVVDSSAPLYPDDRKHIEAADPNRCILILNKVDLGQSISPSAFPSFSVIPVSLLRGQHPRDIVDALALKLAAHSTPTPHAVIGERHRQLLQNALNALNEGSSLLSACFEKNAVPAATLLREALNCIGQMTGRSYSNELLDNIFRRFCVGK